MYLLRFSLGNSSSHFKSVYCLKPLLKGYINILVPSNGLLALSEVFVGGVLGGELKCTSNVKTVLLFTVYFMYIISLNYISHDLFIFPNIE